MLQISFTTNKNRKFELTYTEKIGDPLRDNFHVYFFPKLFLWKYGMWFYVMKVVRKNVELLKATSVSACTVETNLKEAFCGHDYY